MTEQGKPISSADSPGLRILLVEDHEDTLTLMTRLLTGSGHQVKTATSVAAALDAAAAQRFDCVISDLGLPDGSGLELMRELLARAHEPMSGIALTGSADDADVDRCLQAGFTKHLPKPVDLTLLEKILREIR
jgi:CheY-like chemotaxis protein